MSFRPSFKRTFLFAALAGSGLLATGCGNMITTATDLSATPAATISGRLHGGNQPVSGAVVTLYAAGATGYGSAGTQYATTTTANDTSGSFSFTKSAVNTGPTTPGTKVYGCPATGDPQMYIIAKGGNTQGAGNGANSAAAFVAALGTCSTISASTFVNLNEVVSVATLAALQQYFNPLTESFGYAATAQSALGFANGVATIGSLANIATGVAQTATAPASAVAGVTMAATPESAKLNTLANILAACVNTTSATSTQCATLFTNAVPPPSAAVTSQPALTFTAATDTLQAGYYMLTNPTESQDYGATGKLANLFALSAAAAPFQPNLTTQPNDWTLSITYAATGTCTGVGATAPNFLVSGEELAIDSAGNVWLNGGASNSMNALVQVTPTGAPSKCFFNINTGKGLSIDTAGNVWTAGVGNNYEVRADGTPLTWAQPTATTSAIQSDKTGNIILVPSATVATPFQYAGASTVTTPFAPTAIGTATIASGADLYAAPDSLGKVFVPNVSGSNLYAVNAAANTMTDVGAASFVVNGYGAAVDNGNNVFGGSTCCANVVSNTYFRYSQTNAAATNSPKYLGGIVAPRSMAVDGAGNVWAGMGYPVYTAALSPTGVAIYALSEVDNTLTTGLSPNGVTPATCSSTGSNCATTGGFQKTSLNTVRGVGIDPTGNVWAVAQTGALVELIGQGVPTVTPLAAAAAAGQLGAKP